MNVYKFRIELFMEIFCETSGYDRELYASKIAENTAKYIAAQYMDGSSEWWFTEDAMYGCIEKMMEVFEMENYELRRAFV